MVFEVPTSGPLTPIRLAQMGQKFEYESRQAPKLARMFLRENLGSWSGATVEPIGDVKNPQPSFAGIESFEDTSAEQGGDRIRIPVMGRLSKPQVGSTTAKGTEEVIPMGFRDMYLAMGRKTMAEVTGMEAQRVPLKLLNALNDTNSFLYVWHGEDMDGEIQHVMCTGYGSLLTTYRTIAGQQNYATPFSPPNLIVAGQGIVGGETYSVARPGTAGYETDAKSKMKTARADATAGFTMKRVRAGQNVAQRKGIPQLKTPMGSQTTWLIADTQARQLMDDPEFIDKFKYNSQPSLDQNPLFTFERLYSEGNLFFVIPGLFGVQDDGVDITVQTGTTLSMPAYGPSGYWISQDGTAANLDNNVLKIAWIVGPHFLYKLSGRKQYGFYAEEDDYGMFKGSELRRFASLVRGDEFDQRGDYGLTAGSFFKNDSLLGYVTNSPLNSAF